MFDYLLTIELKEIANQGGIFWIEGYTTREELLEAIENLYYRDWDEALLENTILTGIS